MLRKLALIVAPALIMAVIVVSSDDQSSQAFAGGGRGGGGRSGGGMGRSMSGGRSMGRSSSRRSVGPRTAGRSRTASAGRSTRNLGSRGQRRSTRFRGYSWGDSVGGDVAVDGGVVGEGVVGATFVDSVATPAPITILNPANTGRPVNYTLGAGQFSIESAQSLVHNDGTQVIVFDRGGDFGTATYTLEPGTYRFVLTDAGWDLNTVRDEVADTSMDNPG